MINNISSIKKQIEKIFRDSLADSLAAIERLLDIKIKNGAEPDIRTVSCIIEVKCGENNNRNVCCYKISNEELTKLVDQIKETKQ